MKKISIIIPVYNNAGSLGGTYKNLSVYLRKIEKKYKYELIFVNDGSHDNSLEKLLELRKKDSHVKIINFTRNFGQASAVLAGFEYSQSEIGITISADMQDPCQLIIEMISRWEEGYKVVLCVRKSREDDLFSKIGSKIFYGIIQKSIHSMPLGGFDYFLLDKLIYKKLVNLDIRNAFLQIDILWFGHKPYILQYKRVKRKNGKSEWTIGRKIKASIDGIIDASHWPIRLISLVGLAFAFLGFFYAMLVFLSYLFKATPFQGYTPIMIIMLIGFGLIMVMLGVIGEYSWRIYEEIKKKPLYIIENIY